MKVLFTTLLSSFLLLSCTSLKDKKDDPQFAQKSESFLREFFKLHPTEASLAGLPDYDAILDIPNKQTIENKLSFYKKTLEDFQKVEIDDLSLTQRTDQTLVINEMQRRIWSFEEFKNHQWDASEYNLGTAVSSVLEKNNRPLEERIKDIGEKLLKAPEYYQAAKDNIKNPTVEHTRYAIDQNKGLIDYLNGEVKDQIKKSTLSTRDKSTATQRVSAAAAAAKRYVSFLNNVLRRPKDVGGFRSYRLGPEVYAQKFKYELQLDMTPEELYKKALSMKEDVRSKLFETAIALYPKYYGEKLPPKDRRKVITNILDKVAKQHTKPELFLETVRKQIPELEKFIKDKNLLTLDNTQPLTVRETPLYEGTAIGFGASVDAPGPFDKGRQTYYNVTPLHRMSKKEQNSQLREYNDYTLQILNMHEALPGHYVQQVYSNKTSSVIKAIFRNDPTVEGWAVYAERMMLEQGYGENSEELWLMYYKWFLRTVTNAIIDYEVHNKDLAKKDAMKLMTVDAFQEKSEASSKWHRATVTQVQLASYFAGYVEIADLKQQVKKEEGSDFNLKEFHENFLSFGSAPIKEIKKLML